LYREERNLFIKYESTTAMDGSFQIICMDAEKDDWDDDDVGFTAHSNNSGFSYVQQ
jgi:hypothetical protein